LKNALLHSVEEGRAFGGDVVIDAEFDLERTSSLLAPVLTPSVKMLPDYRGVVVELAATVARQADAKRPSCYVIFYNSQQKAVSDVLTKRDENIQCWKDNSGLVQKNFGWVLRCRKSVRG